MLKWYLFVNCQLVLISSHVLQVYNQSQYSKRSIHKAILNGARSLHFYQHSPRMVPDSWAPRCHRMHITVKDTFKPTRAPATVKPDPNQNKISAMFDGSLH